MVDDINGDVEWMMHYQIPSNELFDYHANDCEAKPSGIPRSVKHPDMSPGTGLFSKTARKKGDFILGFPGYWMPDLAFSPESTREGSYAFAVPSEPAWAAMAAMVYVTHPGQANFINAGVVGDEVNTHAHIAHTHV